jgi:hypothetical protein
MMPINIDRWIEMLAPSMPIDLSLVSAEDRSAALDQATGQFDVTKIKGWRDLVKRNERFIEGLARFLLSSLADGEDSPKLAGVAKDLGLSLTKQGRRDLTWLCCEEIPAGPLVTGAILRLAWIYGHSESILGDYPSDQILSWFRRASPETLMDQQERSTLAGLPDRVTAYRGVPASDNDPDDGFSWTLDSGVAQNFAELVAGDGIEGQPRKVVSRLISKQAVIAFLDERQEKQLILDL